MKKKQSKPKAVSPFYKGYDIKWLRDIPEHSDFKLVAEFDAKKK